MKQTRDYQLNFSDSSPAMKDSSGRIRKAKTMVAVLDDYFDGKLSTLHLLDIGASTGIIDHHLAQSFGLVKGIDIDKNAIQMAKDNFARENLHFHEGDALAMDEEDNSFDVVICSQVYEHVPDAVKMMKEIYRILRPGGICYFAASNRFRWNEPHYNLPLLSVLPRCIAHRYIRIFRDKSYYHELHFSYWGLKKLVRQFNIFDYTQTIIDKPERFGTDYMLSPGTLKHRLAHWMARYAYCAVPGYIWLLQKPKPANG